MESFSVSVTLYTDEVSAVGYAQFLGEASKRVAFKKVAFQSDKTLGGLQQFADNTLIVEYVCFKLLQITPGLLARRACVTCLHVFHMVISAVLLLKICYVVPTYYFSHYIAAPGSKYNLRVCIYTKT